MKGLGLGINEHYIKNPINHPTQHHKQGLGHIPSSSYPSSSLLPRTPLNLPPIPHLYPIDTREALILRVYCHLLQAPTLQYQPSIINVVAIS